MENKPKKCVPLSIRIDEELSKRIEEKATKFKRSKSNFVTLLLTNALNDIDRNDFLKQ